MNTTTEVMQGSLSFNDNALGGFRLFRLEVLNWGTFNRRIWCLRPRGRTALLTGENGSGKSTLVDALLTLLVPNQKRHYNLASGPSARRERNETSYVRGAYAKLQAGDELTPQTQYLRPRDSYSVLLGYFRNDVQARDVTLAQVLWYQDGVKKFFVVARRELDIASAFGQFASIRALKERLRSHKAEVFEQFEPYSKCFRQLLGLHADKAVDVFNQTVMIKDIDRLNDFVRQHMLEKTAADENVRQLLDNYENLTRAYEALQKAQQQLAILEPLMAQAQAYRDIEAEIADWHACDAVLPAYFAAKKARLLQAAMVQTRAELTQAQSRYQTLSAHLASLRQQDKDLTLALNRNQVGQCVQTLEQQIHQVQRELAWKKNLARQYNALTREYDLPAYDDEATFNATRQRAERLKPALEQQRQRLDARLAVLRRERDQWVQQRRDIRQELDSLEQRQSRIPVRNLMLRARLIDPLGIDEKDIPFVGELLQVRQTERDWEGAIERLLHNFGLDLLVPEHHYQRFSRHVNRTSWRARIVFHRVPVVDRVTAPRQVSAQALCRKLQIKPDSVYRDWLQAEIEQRFDYECCEDLDTFDRARKAMTKEGLIKSGLTRHEKDDRYELRDPRHYILGWDNTDKMRTLSQEREAVETKLQQHEMALASAGEALAATYAKAERLGTLLRFDDFSALDWRSEDAKLQALQEEKARLTQSSAHLVQVQDELAALQRQIDQVEAQRQALDKTIGGLEHQQRQVQDDLVVCEREQAQAGAEALARFMPRFETLVHGELTLAAVVTEQRRLETYLRTSRETAEVRRRAAMTGLVSTMQRYKSMFPEATIHVDASIHALGDFEQRLARIKTDDLPRYRDRFKNLLNAKILEHLTLLYGGFQRDSEAIHERVTRLNTSLRAIDYTPNTYIQLHAEPTRDAEVRAFKTQLQACLPEANAVVSATDEAAVFDHIRSLVTRFREDARWTQKVTDVRHWLDFAASERYRMDEREKHHYSDSAGKSGGQKVKLAYTILASAIAYQYGLHDPAARDDAFRFVVIDEVFSRSDHENARYAMELFKKLDLQLLVVTPMTALHVVEPFISACHFVFNNLEGNDSQVENMELTRLHGRPAA